MKNKLKVLFMFLTFTLSSAFATPLSQLENTTWQPVFVEGVKNSSPDAYLEFTAKGGISGNSGVNRFNAKINQAKGDSVKIGAIASTRMMGANMDYERAFLNALERTAKIEARGLGLSLLSEKGKLLMELKVFAGEKKAPKLHLLGTKWQPIYIKDAKTSYISHGGEYPFVEFKEEGKINGNTGDNFFNGDYALSTDGRVKLGHLACTMMMGQNGEYEHSFLQALNKTSSLKLQDGLLSFHDKNGELLIHLKPYVGAKKEATRQNKHMPPKERPVAPLTPQEGLGGDAR